MQMVKKVSLLMVVFLLSIVVFAPKDRLYFLLEEQLQKSDVVISNESVDNGLLGMEIGNLSISGKGVTVATVKEVDISTLLLFSSITIDNIVLDESMKAMVPINDVNVSISHSLFAPKSLNVTLYYQEVEQELSIKFLDEGVVRIEAQDINASPWLKPMMQQDEEGWYYEQTL